MRLPEVAKKHKLLFTLAVTFTVLDIVTTYTALTKYPGIFVEGNPFMSKLFAEFGLFVMIPVKASVLVAVTETKTLADTLEQKSFLSYSGRLDRLNDYCRENYDYLVLTGMVLITGSIVVNNLLGLYFVYHTVF